MTLTEKNSAEKSVIVADDHAVVRAGVVDVISQIEGAVVVAEADNGLTAIAVVKKFQPDLLVLDAAMPLARGIEVLADCKRWSPDTTIILFTGFTSANILNDWLQAGVDGILLKNSSAEEMLKAFRTVLEGGRYISSGAKEILETTSSSVKLTNREREVLSMIAAGRQNGEIAERLCLSVRTVEKHRGSLMAKIGVHSVSELLVYALKEGLLDEHRQL